MSMVKSEFLATGNSKQEDIFSELLSPVQEKELVSVKQFTTNELLQVKVSKLRYLKEFTLGRHIGHYDEEIEVVGKKVWSVSQASRWNAAEMNYTKDALQWHNTELFPAKTKDFIERAFKLFTQMDVEVAINYIHTYMMIFQEESTSSALGEINSVENVHKDAYAKILTSLDYPMEFFEEFQNIDVTKKKIAVLHECKNIITLEDLIVNIFVMSILGEGVLLFTMFAALLYLRYIDLLPNVGTAILWSSRDESLHVAYISYLLKRMITDIFGGTWPKSLIKRLENITKRLIVCEEDFIKYLFSNDTVSFANNENNELVDLDQKSMIAYMHYMTDLRLCDINLNPMCNKYVRTSDTCASPIVPHPLPWLASILALPDHTDFFANTPTEYSKLNNGRFTKAWSVFSKSNNFAKISDILNRSPRKKIIGERW